MGQFFRVMMQQHAPHLFHPQHGQSNPNPVYPPAIQKGYPSLDCWPSTEEFLFPGSSPASFSLRNQPTNSPPQGSVSAPSWPPMAQRHPPSWNHVPAPPVHDPRQRWVPPATVPLTSNVPQREEYYGDEQEQQYQRYMRMQQEREAAQRQRELQLKSSPPPKPVRVPSPPLVNSQFGEFILSEVTCPPKEDTKKEKEKSNPIVPNKELVLHPTADKTGLGQNFCDITEYLNMPQTQAAKLLGVPTSTLSKRWKESCPNRKWPWRTINKLDKSIASILQEVTPGEDIPQGQKTKLALLLRQRQEELLPAVIRL